jgi:hypothetical protein
MRCGILTYDTWIRLKITSLSSTTSVLKDSRISLEIPSFYSETFFFQEHQNKVILAISLLISRTQVVLKISVASMTSKDMLTSLTSTASLVSKSQKLLAG